MFSGPHIKQVCAHCGSYVKFISKALVPDSRETKLRVWAITNQDEEAIATAKKSVGFIENLTGIERNMMYWRLYLHIRSNQEKEVEV